MQKYILPLIVLLIVLLIGTTINKSLLKYKENYILSTETEIRATPTPLRLPYGTITEFAYDQKDFLIFWIKVPDDASISLIENFTERIIGEKLTEDNNCDLGINGGFYLGNEKPLGLFYAKGKELGKAIKSSIADVFVKLDLAGDVIITKLAPTNYNFTDFIFQTGPYIIPGNTRLRLARDETARRSLLGKDIQGHLYLINITNKKDLTGGPRLADLPILFWQLKEKGILALNEVANLDGGSASFFFASDKFGNLTLPSWAPVGSLLCIKLPN